MTRTKDDCIRTLSQYAHTPMGMLLMKLFGTEPQGKIPTDDHTYGIECQLVLRDSANYATAGVLTVEESGVLHMVQPGTVSNPNSQHAPPIPILAHHYFMPADILTIVVVQKIDAKASRPSLIVT